MREIEIEVNLKVKTSFDDDESTKNTVLECFREDLLTASEGEDKHRVMRSYELTFLGENPASNMKSKEMYLLESRIAELKMKKAKLVSPGGAKFYNYVVRIKELEELKETFESYKEGE